MVLGKPFDEDHPACGLCECGSEDKRTWQENRLWLMSQPYLPGRSYRGTDPWKRPLDLGTFSTHVYAQQFHILNEKNEIQEFMLEARKKRNSF